MKRLLTSTGIAFIIIPILMILMLFMAIPSQQANTGAASVNNTTAASDCNTSSDDTNSDTTIGGAPTNTVEAWTKRFGDIAFNVGKKYGIPYEMILAQSAWESAWGASAPGHNYFGIKAWTGSGGNTTGTTECDSTGCHTTSATWESYDNDEAGFEGYGQFITGNSNYKEALQYPGDPYSYLVAIKAAGYATAPDYVSKVWSIAGSFINYIQTNKLYPPSSEVTPDRKPDTTTPNTNTDSSTTPVSCNNSTSSSDAVAGSVGGAPDKIRDYSWLCETEAKVCKKGDFGPFNTFKDYQCYWYALVRLWLIHNHDVENWHTEVAGQIPGALASNPEYTVDSTPHPGDGVAQYEGALGGDNVAGHVAVVEEVTTDEHGWRIRISEGNYMPLDGSGGWQGYNTRWLTEQQFQNAGNVFFRKNSWKN